MFFQKLIHAFENQLPGESVHQEMAPSNRPLSSWGIANNTDYKESAVSVIIYPNQSTLKTIVIQRPEYEGNHSGQISFPGGKKEKNDPNLEHTARRECFEEIGIPINKGQLLGELTKVYIPVSNFIVYPYVFYVTEIPNLIRDLREVAEIVHFDLKELSKPENIDMMEIQFQNGKTKKNIPCFTIANKKIWGATALILNELKHLLNNSNIL
ncbi:MAG: CoA pyrophosphatase [Flavobacteriia bacterium]|nr:CoA pyrophosphatase [Flavobacteriia bacterium]